MEVAAAAAGVKLQQPPGPRLVDQVKAALDRDNDLIDLKAAVAEGQVVDIVAVPLPDMEGGTVSVSSPPPPPPAAAATAVADTREGKSTAATINSSSSSDSGLGSTHSSSSSSSSSSSTSSSDIPTASAPSPSSSSSSAKPATSTAPGGSTSHKSSGGKRTWGSWGANQRIQRANVTLIKHDDSSSSSSQPSAISTAGSSSSSVGGAPTSSSNSSSFSSSSSRKPERTADGAMIVSKAVGRKRPKKVDRDPGERVATVKEAFRAAVEGIKGEGQGKSGGEWEGEEEMKAMQQQEQQLLGEKGTEQWWQRRYQAVYLPNIW